MYFDTFEMYLYLYLNIPKKVCLTKDTHTRRYSKYVLENYFLIYLNVECTNVVLQ